MDDINNKEELVLIPSIKASEELISDSSFEKDLNNKLIHGLMIPNTEKIAIPSYLIDMSNLEYVTEKSLEALLSIINGGDTAVYIENGSGVRLLGYGDEDKLNMLIEPAIRNLYNNKCVIYFNNDGKFKPINRGSVTVVRLGL